VAIVCWKPLAAAQGPKKRQTWSNQFYLRIANSVTLWTEGQRVSKVCREGEGAKLPMENDRRENRSGLAGGEGFTSAPREIKAFDQVQKQQIG